jgi:predicted nuclease of predicted toxin-antitoxin system
MKLLLDMNLAPDWCGVLGREGFDAVHWSAVGDGRATDAIVMAWARANGRVVVTHDLDFGALLAATGAEGPSVV